MTTEVYRAFGALGGYFRGQQTPNNSDDELIARLWREIRAGDLVLDPPPAAPFDLVIISDRLMVLPADGPPIDADDFQAMLREVEILGLYTRALKPGDTLLDLYRSILRDRPPTEAVKHLWDLKRAFHFRIVEDLPECRFVEEGGELVIEALDGLGNIDPASVTIRKSERYDPRPIPLDHLALLDVVEPKRLVRVSPPRQEPPASLGAPDDASPATEAAKEARRKRVFKNVLKPRIEQRIANEAPFPTLAAARDWALGILKDAGESADAGTIDNWLRPYQGKLFTLGGKRRKLKGA